LDFFLLNEVKLVVNGPLEVLSGDCINQVSHLPPDPDMHEEQDREQNPDKNNQNFYA